MTIDEAIKHCEEVAEAQEEVIKSRKIYVEVKGLTPLDECRKIAADHKQFAEWLRELKERRAANIEPKDRWISVKDKLPDEMQDKSIYSGWSEEIRPSESVLILTTGGSYDVAWYSYAFNDWTTDNETKSYEDWEVAYWQPLPPKAKGELK